MKAIIRRISSDTAYVIVVGDDGESFGQLVSMQDIANEAEAINRIVAVVQAANQRDRIKPDLRGLVGREIDL